MAGDFRFRLDTHAVGTLGSNHEAVDMLEDIAEQVASVAYDLAPKATGEGAASIFGQMDEDSESAYVDIGPDKDHFYMSFKETGTEHEAPTPFLRPALDQARI